MKVLKPVQNINFRDLVPTSTSSIYSIFFITSFLLSIALVNSGEDVFQAYTSCHGDKTFDITWIGILVLSQCLLLLPTLDKSSIIETDSNSTDNDKSSSSKSGSLSVSPGYEYSKDPSLDNEDKNQFVLDNKDNPVKWLSKTKKNKNKYLICWNSLWMIVYHFILFLGMHGTLLASRIHGIIDLNRYAIDTCQHLSEFPFALTSPALKVPLVSEAVFIIVYLTFTVHELVIRKSENSAYIKNFIGSHYFKESKLLGIIRILLQMVIFGGDILIIVRSFLYGYGSPMHLLVGFSLAMLMLWINSVVGKILQLTYIQRVKTASVDFNWLWSILSGATIWLCGFLFYISVYGLPYYTLYLYIHLLSWIILLMLTYYRGSQIFVLTNITHGWSSTFG